MVSFTSHDLPNSESENEKNIFQLVRSQGGEGGVLPLPD